MQKIEELSSGIWKIDSGNIGNITVLMAGVHGNEKSGQIILDEIKDTLLISKGIVYIIPRANPRAIEQNIRQTEKNMNRAFHKIPQGESYEDLRAQEIIPFLKQSDYLLDIHNTLNTENSIPFLISEHSKWDQFFPVDRVISGLDTLHPGGSDGFMNSIGGVGVCIESGSIYDPKGPEIAKKSVMNFLRATGNIDGNPEIYGNQQRFHLDTIIKAQTTEFRFIKKWLDFETVNDGELIAYDRNTPIYAPYNGVIVFCHETKNIGDEMCVFGKTVQ